MELEYLLNVVITAAAVGCLLSYVVALVTAESKFKAMARKVAGVCAVFAVTAMASVAVKVICSSAGAI